MNSERVTKREQHRMVAAQIRLARLMGFSNQQIRRMLMEDSHIWREYNNARARGSARPQYIVALERKIRADELLVEFLEGELV